MIRREKNMFDGSDGLRTEYQPRDMFSSGLQGECN